MALMETFPTKHASNRRLKYAGEEDKWGDVEGQQTAKQACTGQDQLSNAASQLQTARFTEMLTSNPLTSSAHPEQLAAILAMFQQLQQKPNMAADIGHSPQQQTSQQQPTNSSKVEWGVDMLHKTRSNGEGEEERRKSSRRRGDCYAPRFSRRTGEGRRYTTQYTEQLAMCQSSDDC